MCLAIVIEDILYLLVNLYTILTASLLDNLDTAERLDSTLEKFIGLETYDKFILFVDITGLVRSNCRNSNVVE